MKFKKLNLPKFDLDATLKLLFYLLVLLTFITYIIYKDRQPMLFVYMGFSAIFVRLVHYIISFFRKR